ncbi:pyridoxamine 5'-phosphate oxidase family protein [Ruficoccus amylovorans]|uniref:Pyridoxamine 5'-phosphate oxidase family protein n=1 Tax=Ruficoccus amylovorans TaxID=1804625 RepID=A0A842HBF8_9BACT|nr:pyridoxamine 5'-phosphate oxidase family protein [Ruficoccus amylovorans]MBC2592904.1 pyridoxamine 5'-phosphate oxidase family protein [Ruficoccus amylovorans]
MTQATTSPSSAANDLGKIQDQYEQLLGAFQSLQLATVDAEGVPTASYSPAVLDDERNFYIYVSEIANHTGNLLANGKVSFMVIEDEATSGQIFARKRISFKAEATEVERGSESWEAILGRFEEKFGRVVEHLKGMTDFHLFRLAPQDGRLVLGFGRAYSISADLSQVEHLKGLDGDGHRQGN